MRTRSRLRDGLLGTLLFVAACGSPTVHVATDDERRARAASPAVASEELVTLEDGRTITVAHSVASAPEISGCADGTREAFLETARFPDIAGCAASWPFTQSLRARGTGTPCGDRAGRCASPADACAPGFHVCGVDTLDELRAVDPRACADAGAGRFVSAVSHCARRAECAVDPEPHARHSCWATGYCSEPVCCGSECAFGACRDGVWPGETRIAVGPAEGCGAHVARPGSGVLCCRTR